MELQHVLSAIRAVCAADIAVAHDRAERMPGTLRRTAHCAAVAARARLAAVALVNCVCRDRRAAVRDVGAVRVPRAEIVAELVADDASREADVDLRIREDLVDAVAPALRLRFAIRLD